MINSKGLFLYKTLHTSAVYTSKTTKIKIKTPKVYFYKLKRTKARRSCSFKNYVS